MRSLEQQVVTLDQKLKETSRDLEIKIGHLKNLEKKEIEVSLSPEFSPKK